MLLIALLIGAGLWVAKKHPEVVPGMIDGGPGSWVYDKTGARTWVPPQGGIIDIPDAVILPKTAAEQARAAPRIPDGQGFNQDMSTTNVPTGSGRQIPRTPPNTLFTMGLMPRSEVDKVAALTAGAILTSSSRTRR
jgi:hypothetical protein